MKLYADLPGLRLRQVLLDLAVLAWSLGWLRMGQAVHRQVLKLAAPGRTLESAGGDLSRTLGDAAERAEGVPLLGGPLSAPLDGASGAAARLAAAGAGQQDAVARLALLLALAVALAPTLAVLLRWLPGRARWAREASAAARLLAGRPDDELFALRALAHRPLHELRRVHPEPGHAYREGDREVVHRLAALELAALGLRPVPPPTPAGPGRGRNRWNTELEG